MRKSGFTLVEVALALLVVGVGIVAIFGLFPAGMEAGRRTVNETQAALFAEEVFAAYRSLASVTNLATAANAQVPVAAPEQWSSPPLIIPDGSVQTCVLRAFASPNSIERALRYRLTIGSSGPYIRTVSLRVFPGEFGGTSEFYDFYTEIGRTMQ